MTLIYKAPDEKQIERARKEKPFIFQENWCTKIDVNDIAENEELNLGVLKKSIKLKK